MVELLDRLDYVRSLVVDADRARRIHTGRLVRLVDEGGIMTAQHIADLEPARRTAILMAQVAHLDTRVADATLAMFEKYIGSLFTKARSKDERRFQATKRKVAKALLLFRRTIAALKRAKQVGDDGVAVVEREVGMAQLDRALPTIEAVSDVANQDMLRRLYETAVLAALGDRLRGADIWVAGSRDYRAFEDYLLPADGQAVAGGIGGETDPARYMAARPRCCTSS